MMPEIALNVLDIAQNSVRAKASLIQISVTVDEAGNIDWNPQTNGLENGTYEYYLASIDAWHTSTNISDLNENDRMYGKMMITISDTGRECEFYLDLDAIAEKLGCNAEEFKVIKAQFGRIGQQWLVTAGASSGAYAGVLACVATVAVVWGIQKKQLDEDNIDRAFNDCMALSVIRPETRAVIFLAIYCRKHGRLFDSDDFTSGQIGGTPRQRSSCPRWCCGDNNGRIFSIF